IGEKTPFEKNTFLLLFRGGPPIGMSILESIKARFVPHIGQLVTVAGPNSGVYPVRLAMEGGEKPPTDTDTSCPVFEEGDHNPDPWEHVQFEARPANILIFFVKHRVHSCWINSLQTFRLYVVSLTRELIQRRMYFSAAFSFLLPEVPAPLVMRFKGRSVLTNATIIKVIG
ncbi:hypothetical protein EJB05_09233, partial [Eragrostis curvula]